MKMIFTFLFLCNSAWAFSPNNPTFVFAPSGASNLTNGIVGTTSANNANAGNVGEFISANASSTTPTTSNVYQTLASISLPPGDWDVTGQLEFINGTATVATRLTALLSLINNSADTFANGGGYTLTTSLVASGTYESALNRRRINVSTTTTVYLVGKLVYTTLSTATYGVDTFISARRIR